MDNTKRPYGAFLPRDHTVHPPPLTPQHRFTILRSPRQPLIRIDPSLSDTTGPVFNSHDVAPGDNNLLTNYATSGPPIGERIVLHGYVLDQQGKPVPNALVEMWQANAGGRYRHRNDPYSVAPLDPNFGGCGRVLTDRDGHYVFRTIRPGAYPVKLGGLVDWRAAHIHFSISGSGWAQRLITQMYFEGDPLIQSCLVVQGVPSESQIRGLIARQDPSAFIINDSRAYRFDIILRGRHATWFEPQTSHEQLEETQS